MIYEVKYRCFPKKQRGDLFDEPTIFPFISMKYRKKGEVFWSATNPVYIDFYTCERFRNTYYKDYHGTLQSDYERLSLFKTILDNEFDGSIDKYALTIVREMICMEIAEEEENLDARELALQFTTDGWKTAEISIEKEGSSQ